MGASPHPTRDGRPWTLPPDIQSTFSNNVPVMLERNHISHGHGGHSRQPDALHPEKTRKNAGWRKQAFSNRRFLVFIVPV